MWECEKLEEGKKKWRVNVKEKDSEDDEKKNGKGKEVNERGEEEKT